MIDHLAESHEGRAIAYYFFDFRRKESLSTLTFLRSILHQLLQIDNITPKIQRRIEAIFVGATGTREPEVSELQELITDICASIIREELLFIVDGIDEANGDILRGVLRFLGNMQSCSRVKIFAAGQPEVLLANFLARWETIFITAQELEKDIRTFIDVNAERELKGILSLYGSELIDTVKDVLSRKAQGMYVEKIYPISSIPLSRNPWESSLMHWRVWQGHSANLGFCDEVTRANSYGNFPTFCTSGDTTTLKKLITNRWVKVP